MLLYLTKNDFGYNRYNKAPQSFIFNVNRIWALYNLDNIIKN